MTWVQLWILAACVYEANGRPDKMVGCVIAAAVVVFYHWVSA